MQPQSQLQMVNGNSEVMATYQLATGIYPNSYMPAADYAIVLQVAQAWKAWQLNKDVANNYYTELREKTSEQVGNK